MIVLRVTTTSSRRRHNGVWWEYNPFYSLPSPRTSSEIDGTFNIFSILMGGLKFSLIIPKTKYYLYKYFLKNVKTDGMAHKNIFMYALLEKIVMSVIVLNSKHAICQIMPTFEQIG